MIEIKDMLAIWTEDCNKIVCLLVQITFDLKLLPSLKENQVSRHE